MLTRSCRKDTLIDYHRRFLAWWGILLFGLGLGSRRAVDQDLRDSECAVLDNINRLAGTDQKSLPVSKTLDHFLGHIGYEPFAGLRYLCMHRLLRMKALDDFRFQGDFVVDIQAGTLTVRLRYPTNPMMANAVEHLCRELTKTEITYPATNLRLVYELVSN